MVAATFTIGVKNPVSGTQQLDPKPLPSVLAVTATAGIHDDAG